MFNIRLDFSKSEAIKINNQEIPFFDEISLINFVCDVLYEKQVAFIVSDDNCSDYGMNCKFDLPCLLEIYDDVICGLLKKQDFSIEFCEQGREYFISFVIFNDDVEVTIRYGYDNTYSKKEELAYCYVKKMFVDFYETLFEYINKCFSNVEKNCIFEKWNMNLWRLGHDLQHRK